MKNLKFKVVFFTILCLFSLGNSFAQAQKTFKGMYWNGKNLELIEVEMDTNSFEVKTLYYQPRLNAKKTKIQLNPDTTGSKYTQKYEALNPQTQEQFTLSLGMTTMFSYPNGDTKEFLYAMEYVNEDEKIIMGVMPILGEIIYQKGDQTPEIWLENADELCKAEAGEDNTSFNCEFTTAKGENLRLRIDQMGKQVTLWRSGEKIEFREP